METIQQVEKNNRDSSIDKTIDTVDGVIRSTMDTVKDQSQKYVNEAKKVAESAKHVAEEKYGEVEDIVKSQSEQLVNYIKEQPVKSVLIALGAGYALSCLSSKK